VQKLSGVFNVLSTPINNDNDEIDLAVFEKEIDQAYEVLASVVKPVSI
jgi:dihydrodipicolinate synthase/N-acetylneuraminate lyase